MIRFLHLVAFVGCLVGFRCISLSYRFTGSPRVGQVVAHRVFAFGSFVRLYQRTKSPQVFAG